MALVARKVTVSPSSADRAWRASGQSRGGRGGLNHDPLQAGFQTDRALGQKGGVRSGEPGGHGRGVIEVNADGFQVLAVAEEPLGFPGIAHEHAHCGAGLVFVAAFAPDEGETLGDVEGGSKDSVLNAALVQYQYPAGPAMPPRADSRPGRLLLWARW